MYFNKNNKSNTNIDSEFSTNKKNKINLLLIIIGIVILALLLFLILLRKDSVEYYLVINGNKDIILTLGSDYIEEGCKAYDSKGIDHTNEIIIEGEVNTKIVGNYVIECMYQDMIERKTVTVINQNKSNTIITLNGDNIIYLKLGEKYNEPGYNVIDSMEQNLNSNVVVTNNIDETKPGTYKVIYKLTKNNNEIITKERTVIIMATNVNIYYDQTKYTKDKVLVDIYIYDNYFDYVLLPNNEKIYNRSFTYEITENGKYTFFIYNKKGNVENREIEIKTIDKSNPTGSCSATIGENTIINANFKDNNAITNYTYIIDNKEIKTTNQNILTTNNNQEVEIKVKVQDIAGNEIIKDCKVEIIKPKVDQTAKVVTGGNSWVVNKDEFYIINTKNDVSSLEAKFRAGGIGSANFPDKCLSFAYTYAYLLVYGTSSQINSLTGEKGASYSYGSFTGYDTDNLVEYLQKTYELLSQNIPVIIHVSGNLEGTSRHYITAVGYRKGKTKETILQTDLLVVDSYDARLERMDASNSRFIITGYATGRKGASGYGYRMYILK